VAITSETWDLIKVENIHQMTLKFYVNNKALTTLTYTPQLNGVAEINNRTILDMARCLLKAKKLPKQYWAGVISCVMYLLSMPNQKSVSCLSRKTMEWSQTKWYSSSSLFFMWLMQRSRGKNDQTWW